MSRLIVVLLLFLASCAKRERKLLLNVNPLNKNYAKNGVKSYVRYTFINDSVFKLDSTVFNSKGYKIKKVALEGWRSETLYEYDSLNRVVKENHTSCVRSELYYVYEINEEKKEVIKRGFGVGNKEIVRSIYKFNKDFSLLKEKLKTELITGDTLCLSKYNYDKKMITSVFEKKIEQNDKNIIFLYEGLCMVKKEIYIEGFKDPIEYFLSERELIDSVVNTHLGTIYYKYYFK